MDALCGMVKMHECSLRARYVQPNAISRSTGMQQRPLEVQQISSARIASRTGKDVSARGAGSDAKRRGVHRAPSNPLQNNQIDV